MEISQIQSELWARVPGVVDLTCDYAAVANGHAPSVLRVDIHIDPTGFERTALERVLADLAADFIRVGDVYRGSFSNGHVRFRMALVVAPGIARPRRGFWFLAPVTDVDGDRIAAATDRALDLACHHLLDASLSLAFGDLDHFHLYIAYARSQILSCLAMQSRRASSTSMAFVPFGPYRTVAATMIAVGTSPDALAVTLEALEATRLLAADFRSHGDLPPSHVLQALRREVTAPGADRRGRATWYDHGTAAIYDQVRDLPCTVTSLIGEIIKDLGLQTVAELGCGTGRLSLAIAPECERVYCIDSSQEMLTQLKSKAGDGAHVVPMLASMGATGLPAGSVDSVLEFEAFYLFPNPARLCREVSRILRPGGVILRVVKIDHFDLQTERSFQLFDELISARSPEGICFVGENIDEAVDGELAGLGIRSCCFRLFSIARHQTVEASLAARRQRAFPYLAHVPDSVLSDACAAALIDDCDRMAQILTDYYVVVAFRDEDMTRMKRVTRLFERLVPHSWKPVPGIPRS